MPRRTTTRIIPYVVRPLTGVHAALCPDCASRTIVEARSVSKLGQQLESHRVRKHLGLYDKVVLRKGDF